MVRDHQCLDCKHTWTKPVTLSKWTANLSGEETPWCPKCGTRSVMSMPAREPTWDERTTYKGPKYDVQA